MGRILGYGESIIFGEKGWKIEGLKNGERINCFKVITPSGQQVLDFSNRVGMHEVYIRDKNIEVIHTVSYLFEDNETINREIYNFNGKLQYREDITEEIMKKRREKSEIEYRKYHETLSNWIKE